MENITAEKLKQIGESWGLTQSQFAELLGANLRTFQDWAQGRHSIPAPIQKHVQTIQKLREIYESWDKIATPLSGTEEFDGQIDDHEKLWDKHFPELNRLTPHKS